MLQSETRLPPSPTKFRLLRTPNETMNGWCRGWIVAYNSLLNGCAKSGVMAAAEEVMKGMQEEGPSPDVTSYNTIISGYAKVAPPPWGAQVECLTSRLNHGRFGTARARTIVCQKANLAGGSSWRLEVVIVRAQGRCMWSVCIFAGN